MADLNQGSPERTQRTIRFSGHVQGVGFRYTVEQIARGFAVTGFVRNLSDGRVELVAQGTTVEIDRFVGEIHRVMRGHIDSLESTDSALLTARADFRIER